MKSIKRARCKSIIFETSDFKLYYEALIYSYCPKYPFIRYQKVNTFENKYHESDGKSNTQYYLKFENFKSLIQKENARNTSNLL